MGTRPHALLRTLCPAFRVRAPCRRRTRRDVKTAPALGSAPAGHDSHPHPDTPHHVLDALHIHTYRLPPPSTASHLAPHKLHVFAIHMIPRRRRGAGPLRLHLHLHLYLRYTPLTLLCPPCRLRLSAPATPPRPRPRRRRHLRIHLNLYNLRYFTCSCPLCHSLQSPVTSPGLHNTQYVRRDQGRGGRRRRRGVAYRPSVFI
ncbi:hypothetical protein DENSPDRAFT_254859 [Dentipellis sp. KUC8613]|nr:hypothetical protein DENSPDRAFT_254859 [Dentipellis sp. KUC8613]